MALFKRLSLIFKSKASKQLDKLENPNETLDYSYAKQLELITKMKRGLTDVAASRKRVEMQATALRTQADTLTEQAQRALSMGREDLAREALTRKANLATQLTDLTAQQQQLEAEEAKLTEAIGRLQAKVEAFRTQKETIKARYTAAQAQTRIGEAFAGISGEMADVGHAIARAEDKTAQLQARASAVDELLASGALDDTTGLHKDALTRELDAMAASSSVEAELARLKGELPGGPGRKELR